MKKILFVCLGNICRSPLAQGIARDYIRKNNLDIQVDSAGTGDWHIGDSPFHYSVQIAKDNNIDISDLKARQVTQQDFIDFDLIVGLDEKNMADLKNLGCTNVIKLGSVLEDNPDIPDPYFFDGYEGYDAVFDLIEKCVIKLIKENK